MSNLHNFLSHIDYGFLLFLVCLAVFAAIIIFVIRVDKYDSAQAAFDLKEREFQICLSSEHFTRDECLQLVGRKNDQ